MVRFLETVRAGRPKPLGAGGAPDRELTGGCLGPPYFAHCIGVGNASTNTPDGNVIAPFKARTLQITGNKPNVRLVFGLDRADRSQASIAADP
jgi:hypothetical protein